MQVSIIGTGNVGGSLGKALAAKGHKVIFGSRDVNSDKIKKLLAECSGSASADSIPQAVAASQIIAITTPAAALPEVIEAGGSWQGKIIIDAMNRFPGGVVSLAEEVAGLAIGAQVVKAFNTIGAEHLLNPALAGQTASMLICGDDAQAKRIVGGLVQDLGFELVDAGALANAVMLESLARLWVSLVRGGAGDRLQAVGSGQMTTGRIGALTDGVFAIVMTLLIFEMRIPEHAANLGDHLRDLLPNFVSFLISFVILGVYWVAHHAQFQFIQRTDQNLLWFNIIFLMCVSFIPFSAGMLGRYGNEQIAALIYSVNLICVAVAHFAMWQYATTQYRLIAEDTPAPVVALGKRLALLPIAAYVLAIGVSFISETASIVIFALVPLPYVTGILYRSVT